MKFTKKELLIVEICKMLKGLNHVAVGAFSPIPAAACLLSKKLNNDPKTIYVLMGDGELQEGQNWEAAMYASANKVDNLICTIDLNGQQIDGSTKDVLDIGDLDKKLESFGWEVLKIKNGNSLNEVFEVISSAKEKTGNGKPVIIIMKTIIELL